MGDVPEVQLQIKETRGSSCSPQDAEGKSQLPALLSPKLKHWSLGLRVALYSFFILTGQTAGILLGRFYYNEGGNSKWLSTIVSSAGFPILIPLLLFSSPAMTSPSPAPLPPFRHLATIYIALGLIIAGDNLMFSYGLLYLPVSTFSLVGATQLAFNAIFSYFLNSQKFTALICNSVVLVTFTAILLGVNSGSEDASNVSKGQYILGFILTLGASAIFSLILSLMQLTYQKVLKRENLFVVLQMLLCIGSVATVAAVVGLFASGEWRGLQREMEEFRKGKVLYVTTLVCIAICWQVTSIGLVGLTFAVSSLFSNMISTFAVPLVPVSAAVFFHDKLDGVKAMALLIAVWGFCSYIYQDYLDHSRARRVKRSDILVIASE